MRELKYDIGLNDEGNPFVKISKEYEENPEDKFVIFQLTTYILMNISPKIKDDQTKADIDYCIDALGKLSGYVGNLLKGIMITNGEMDRIANKDLAIEVNSYDDLVELISTNISCGYFIHDVKMYDVDKGIVFKIKDSGKIYSYFDGELILND